PDPLLPVREQLHWAVEDGKQRRAAGETGFGFTFGVGSRFFLEIAKLRAARLLWFAATGETIRIHVRCPVSLIDDANLNLLPAKTQAMAAILGGADTLLIAGANLDSRLARNIERLLREESHLDAARSAADGCWYLDALTRQLAGDSARAGQARPLQAPD